MTVFSLGRLGRAVRDNRRSILVYSLLNAPLVVWTVVPFVTQYGWLRASTRSTGFASLMLLIAVLAVSPLARLLKRPELLRYRRAIGLAAFFYALSHTVIYSIPAHIWEESFRRFMRRRYILWGIAALFFLIPLAVTSTNASIVRMGPARWRRLHMGVFAALALTVVHYALPGYSGGYWRVYAALGLILAGWRVWQAAADRRRVRDGRAGGVTVPAA